MSTAYYLLSFATLIAWGWMQQLPNGVMVLIASPPSHLQRQWDHPRVQEKADLLLGDPQTRAHLLAASAKESG